MSSQNQKFHFFPLLICLLIPLVIGVIGGFITMESVRTWYPTLNKPKLNPPNTVFGPVWTALYLLMGIASYLVWRKRKIVSGYAWAVRIYFLQLLLNLFWSYLFFHQQQVGAAIIEIGILLIAIIINAFIFYRINKAAGWLFLPYILWVGFASYLTYSIYILN